MAGPHSVKRVGKAPISTHPAFPAIVGLWFACLLGLGSLVLPIALFERLIAVSGMAALVPAVEPPLGFAAHAVIALTGALGGAAAGLLLARQLACFHDHGVRSRASARTETRDCRPIAAHAELGEEGFEWLDALFAHGSPISDGAERSSAGNFAAPAGSHSDEGPAVGPVIFARPIQRFSVAELSSAAAATCPPIDDRPLEEPGLVQLAGRLSAAIEKRRALKASLPATTPPPAPFAPADFEAAEPEAAARAIASFFGSEWAPVGGEAGHQASEPGNGTPPAMKNPFSRHEEFVQGNVRGLDRRTVEPIVTDPVAGPAGPSIAAQRWLCGSPVAPIARPEEYGNTEDFAAPPSLPRDRAASKRDLRAALATLQRISGAA